MPEYIGYFPKPFLEDIVQGRCLPFVGAGLSRNAHTPEGLTMPDWEELGRQVASALPDYRYTTAIEAMSAYAHEYSRAKLVELLGVALCLNSAQPGGAHQAFCRLPFERVATTNFDFLLERTYASLNQYCLPLIAEDQLAVGTSQAGVRLLKLHGDLHHPSRLVATEEDYDAFLGRYPLLATYLASLLIDSTALFIGYSLDDPDLRQIWHVVKERLGVLRRPAYVLQVDAPAHIVARYDRRGVKVINLPSSSTRSYGQVLETAFHELQEFWTSELRARSTVTETESQAELLMPNDARGRMCFFAVPTRDAAFYKAVVYPIAERYGFSPIMAADVVAPGDNVLAKTSALIEKAVVILADISTPNTALEVGMAWATNMPERRLIIVSEDGLRLPSNESADPVILRPHILDEADEQLLGALRERFAALTVELALSGGLDEEPRRLLDKEEYRAAAISAFSVLEHELRTTLAQLDRDAVASRMTQRQVLQSLMQRGVLSTEQYAKLRGYIVVRNQLVHNRESIAPEQAREMLQDIEDVVKCLRSQRMVSNVITS